MYFLGKKNGIWDSDEKLYRMCDSREKRAGMRDQDPPFQTLLDCFKNNNEKVSTVITNSKCPEFKH